ncbi:hypothetical protein ACHHYP_11193 [Achlya hypogyna]|uniref:EF-hand domain-containing protein n=1 Tax=Achlya hypogyna TaxID=1202772 RepID=A0A1V9YJJ6_ACHHY|nr:hypothetical protein ACHHYP_11193 [Achlya hypogyna]
MNSRRPKAKLLTRASSPNLTIPTREEVVLEFYNPHLRVSREGVGLNDSVKRALAGLDRIGSPKSPSKLPMTFVDPLEECTKRDLRKSNLLHPLPTSPQKSTEKPPVRCQHCFSSNVVMLPSCAYCNKLHVFSDVNTKAKRYAFALLEKEPGIEPRQLLDSVFGYLYELQDPVATKRDVPMVLTLPDDVMTINSTKDEATHLIRHAEASPTAQPTTRDAILELKQARAKVATKVALSQPTKVSLVQYVLDALSQPSSGPTTWTREQRWDHQDVCVELLKLLPMEDVDDVVRTYNAWKHVNDVNQKQREMERAWNQRLFQVSPDSVDAADSNDDNDCETSRILARPLTLFEKKTLRVPVTEEHRRSLIAQHQSSQRHIRSVKVDAAPDARPLYLAPVVSISEEVDDTETNNVRFDQLIMNAERYKTTSSNGMFQIDHLALFEQVGLSTRDMSTLLAFDRRTQQVYLLADEGDRAMLLHLSSLGRVGFVADWLGRNVDNELLLIAATSAKAQLLTTEERRLILAMDEEDIRYHLSLWKHMQGGMKHLHFLHLNLPHHEREKLFRVPRYWQKFVKARDASIQPMPHAVIRPFILQIYLRCAREQVDEYDLCEFVVEHMTLSFGAATQMRLQGFITALEQYYTTDSWVFTFCRFCHVTEKLPAGCFRFYLSAVLCLRFSTPNRAQMADYVVPKELFHPLLASKAKMALRAIAQDAVVNDDHWMATFLEMRTVCPRAKGVQSSHLYVVGLGVFMDLVLSIWHQNRTAMTEEMTWLFGQFDTDGSKSLSYVEFKAFITHCSACLEEKKRHPSGPLMQRRASLHSLLVAKIPENRAAAAAPKDEKDIIKLYAKCLMQSDKDEVNVDSFVLGGLDNPLILALLGFPVPPTQTSAAGLMAMQLVKRAVRAYIHRKRRRAEEAMARVET